MKEMNMMAKSISAPIKGCPPPPARVNISSPKSYSNSPYLSIAAQPPKPPCWQDFIGKNIHTNSSQHSSNLNSSFNSSLNGDKKKKTPSSAHRSRHKKASSLKSKAISSASQTKLKRTQSEPCIAEKEIPQEAVQYGLSSTQLSQQSMDEAKRYLEDTYRKCSQWLAQIPATTSLPLEDTDFQTGHGVLITCSEEMSCKLQGYQCKRNSLTLQKIPE